MTGAIRINKKMSPKSMKSKKLARQIPTTVITAKISKDICGAAFIQNLAGSETLPF